MKGYFILPKHSLKTFLFELYHATMHSDFTYLRIIIESCSFSLSIHSQRNFSVLLPFTLTQHRQSQYNKHLLDLSLADQFCCFEKYIDSNIDHPSPRGLLALQHTSLIIRLSLNLSKIRHSILRQRFHLFSFMKQSLESSNLNLLNVAFLTFFQPC